MKLSRLVLVIVAAFVSWPALAHAQAPVFGNSMAYAPTVDTVSTGVLLDVQGTVSADRKYVTLTMRPQQSQLIDMFTFSFGGNATQPSGVVGGGGGGGGNGGPGARQPASQVPAPGSFGAVNPPVTSGPGVGAVLRQRGMTRIAPAN